ncbi:hypothetical protein Sjap_014245 [Stephania japonica]|uniref:Cation/H+ exchanger domain-containing protein n=1 Tax=Stephania japonica TaxID=461633 RepID=A0AAP0NZF4_9MAGN
MAGLSNFYKGVNWKTGIGIGSSITTAEVVCFHSYNTESRGFWSSMPYLSFTVPTLLAEILVIYITTQLLAFLRKPLRQSFIVVQVVAGIILGPTILGRNDELRFYLFPVHSVLPLGNFAELGFMIFQFLVGVKMDPKTIFTSGGKALVIGILSFVIPVTLGTTASVILANAGHLHPNVQRMLIFVGAAQSMTTFPVIAGLLSELKILNSELGRLALSSAMVSDQSFSFLNMVSTNWKLNRGGLRAEAIFALLLCILYIVVVAFVIRPLFLWVIKQTTEGEPVKEKYIILIILAALGSGFISIAMGQNAYFGPFILGLAVPDGPPLGTTLVKKLDPFASGLLVPMFLTLCGLETNFNNVDIKVLKVVVVIIVVCLLGKIVGVLLPALYCRIPIRESLSLALIMCGKGIIEMATYNAWLNTQIIDAGTFSVMVVSVVLVTAMVTPLVKFLYDPSRKYAGYIKRTIQHTRKNAELRVLACVHEEEEVPGLIRLLEISNPTRESPLYIYVVHLVELVGRAMPVLVTHYMWEKKSSQTTLSRNIVNNFRRFNHKNQTVLSVQAFTTISPYETMHDDICMTALDKGTSMIILPFHKQWNANGTIASNKPALRTLNSNVLKRAPCSIAIFVDREKMHGSTTTNATHISSGTSHVALLFLGGADDREALAYAQRMVTDTSTQLKVLRLVAADDPDDVDEWQKIIDGEALKMFKLETSNYKNAVYFEITVKDVEETSTIIRALENECSMLIVGRRYGVSSPITAGLSAWSEFPELGAMGDMLTSSSFQSRVSVLVVQQQIARTDFDDMHSHTVHNLPSKASSTTTHRQSSDCPLFFEKFLELQVNVFPIQSQLTIINTAMMGFTIFQFLVGVRMDPAMIFFSGRKALAIGIVSFVIPATLATTATVIYANLQHLKIGLMHMLILVGAAQSMTTFPAVASMLSELKIRNSELGRLAMSSAMIGDQSYSILSLLSANWKLNQHGLHSSSIYAMLLGIAYVAFIAFIVRPVFIWIIKRTPDGEPVKEVYITLILLAALASGFISIALGQNAYFGPFILGLAIPDGPPLGTTLVNKIEPIISGLLMPMFIALCGLDMDFNFIHIDLLTVLVIIIVVCLMGKIVGVLLLALYCQIPFRESLSLALIMSGKGTIELAVYHFWLHTKVIDRGTFTIMLTSVAVVTGTMISLVRFLYDPSKKYAGYIKRTIQHARKKAGLRILTCVHEEEEVPALIKLLEASNPTRESPLYIYVVHLIELVGREAPVLANHHMWKKKSSKATASGSIVNIFRRFNHQNQGVLSVQAFTTICPYETMHDDICMLALDKGTSLIVIPFHKRWTADGAITSIKPALRTLNSNVLERAPCSVAIFADREIMRGLTTTTTTAIPTDSFHVALLFLGGADDREALAYAQRMATDSGIKLSVVRLAAANDPNVDEWQNVLDDEALKNFQLETYLNGNVLYAEIVTKDVEQTSAIIRSLENWNNLIIVGRRHGVSSPITAGFLAWSECPELGAMGDLLTSSSFQSRVSILVVQQQIVRTD